MLGVGSYRLECPVLTGEAYGIDLLLQYEHRDTLLIIGKVPK